MGQEIWAIGVDLGGTKVEVAAVDARGRIHQRLKQPTDVTGGPEGIIADIVGMARQLRESGPPSPPAGLGVGVAGQVAAATGVVRFAPNLMARGALTGPAPVPAPAGGDHQRCAGRHLGGMAARRRPGGHDPICLFIGTGIGGGVVSGGRMIEGCTNTAGELGHIPTDLDGPRCTCGHRGCLEALAGGWAIARRAREAIRDAPAAGQAFLQAAGLKNRRPEDITAGGGRRRPDKDPWPGSWWMRWPGP